MKKRQSGYSIPPKPDLRLAASNDLSLAPKRHSLLAFLALTVILLALVACGRTTPPGPNVVYGAAVGEASYVLLDWEEGLRILIWDDIVGGGHFNHGSGSTTDPLFRQTGGAKKDDGRGYDYHLETQDGQMADFTIDGIPYDLEQGTLFLIRAAEGETQVQQLDLDLSNLKPTNDGIVDFGRTTPEIASFIVQ